MRMQSHQNSCGPTSLSNALKALGRDVSEARVVAAMKAGPEADRDGAGPANLKQAAAALGYVLDPVTLAPDLAWIRLVFALRDESPAILAVDYEGDAAGHWVAAVGLLGSKVLVADPANPEIVVPLDRDTLTARWKSDSDPPVCYALYVHKAKRARKPRGEGGGVGGG